MGVREVVNESEDLIRKTAVNHLHLRTPEISGHFLSPFDSLPGSNIRREEREVQMNPADNESNS